MTANDAPHMIRIEHKTKVESATVGPFPTRREATDAIRRLHPELRLVADIYVERFYPAAEIANAVAHFLLRSEYRPAG